MKLPRGVSYNPRQPTLISNELALITVDKVTAGNEKYRIEEQFVDEALEESFRGAWERFDLLFRIKRYQKIGEYAGPVPAWSIARHDDFPRLPQITVVPNLPTALPNVPVDERGTVAPYIVLGCDFGRWIPAVGEYRIRRIYEFQSPGIAVIDRDDGEVDLCVGRERDKLAVSAGSHVTFYNLGDRDHPLVVLSFDGDEGTSARDPMTKSLGPLLLGYYDDLEAVFVVNRLHINRGRSGSLRIPMEVTDRDCTIRIVRTSRQDLGSFLYDQFYGNAELAARFTRLGINVRRAPFDAVIEPLPPDADGATKLFFSRPLAEAVMVKGAKIEGTEGIEHFGTRVYRFFFQKTKQPHPVLSLAWPRLRQAIASAEPRPPSQPTPLDRPLVVVVEGAGDWVEKAYRPRFDEIGGEKLSVYYADDSRWTRGRPKWVDAPPPNGLAEWETYLDKAKPEEFLRYSLLRPDAVFVVTPDFLHATTAASWLGKTPVVFVEKPFDTDLRQVEGLQFTAQSTRTEVVGLDHYQYYVAPLWQLREHITAIVSDSLERVVFVLAEDREIEEGRERSLQHGLTLDLLPHFLALLTFFGDIETIDEISIPHAWRYIDPPSTPPATGEEETFAMQNETAAVIDFTFEDASGTGHRIPCRAVVGKGFGKNVKYLEVQGATGDALRIDLNEKPSNAISPNYPWDSVFFLSEKRSHEPMKDPYLQSRDLHVVTDGTAQIKRQLHRKRYRKLFDDLLNGTDEAMSSSLSISQGGQIVHVLDRIWWAVQNAKPWTRHPLKSLDPLDFVKDFK